jgi:hypothetical protein
VHAFHAAELAAKSLLSLESETLLEKTEQDECSEGVLHFKYLSIISSLS